MPQEVSRRIVNRTVKSIDDTDSKKLLDDNKLTDKEKLIKMQKDLPIETQNLILNREPYNDDIELDETNADQEFRWKTSVTEKFRELLDETKLLQQDNSAKNKQEIKGKYCEGLLLCATIKKLNRVSHLRVNKARNKTFEDKNIIDEHHLELQNLLYEITHIKKEINKCLEFRSLDEDINLVPVDEFYKNAPKEISNQEVTKSNEHKLKLARLDWELNERQMMLDKIKSFESKIESYQTEIKSKSEQLDSLHPKLNQIIDACKPTLQYLNMNFNEECSINEFVQLLPRPLYTLYMMLLAYRDTIDKSVKIEVSGDLEDAKQFNSNETINLEEDDSDSAEEDVENENYNKKKNKSKLKNKSISLKDKLFVPFPLSVKVIFSVKNTGQIILNFYYLNMLKIVTVKTDLKLDKDIPFIDNSVLRADTVFSCLYIYDDGTESPNISNQFIFNSLGIKSIENYIKNVGWPYKWCQALCGLYFSSQTMEQVNKNVKQPLISKVDKKNKNQNNEINNSVELQVDEEDDINNDDDDDDDLYFSSSGPHLVKNETKLFQKIIFKLKSRFKARVILQETLYSLKKNIIPTVNSFPHTRQITSKLVSFKETSYEKILTCNYADHLIAANLINENECTFYEINLHNGLAKLQAQIIINQNYPRVTPLFAININWKHDRSFKNDEALRDLERELNMCKDNFVQYESNGAKNVSYQKFFKNYELLSKQINHLVVCFDIYLESECYSLKSDEFPRLKFFINPVRGKDRKRPYSYVVSRDLFVQRLQYDTLKNNNF